VALACIALVALGAGRPSTAEPTERPTIQAVEVAARLAAGDAYEATGVTITGSLDLTAIDTVSRVFRCVGCTIDGAVRASNVIFERAVDFSGTTIAGSIDAAGAEFRDSFLLRRTGDVPADVLGTADFTLAAFDGHATFDGASFHDVADFSDARFATDASFADTTFGVGSRFDSAIFESTVDFASTPGDGPHPACPGAGDAVFGGPVSFEAARFDAGAGFRRRCFVGDAIFSGASFGAGDFTLATFGGPARFDDVSSAADLSFRGVLFAGDVFLQRAVMHGRVDFEQATISGSLEMAAANVDELSLAAVVTQGPLYLDQLRAGRIELDIDKIPLIYGSSVQRQVLAVIEARAREDGDLGLANEAAYRRAELETARLDGLPRLIGVANAEIAGYLVKPLVPLLVFGYLFVVVFLIRAAGRLREALADARAQRAPARSGPAIPVRRSDRPQATAGTRRRRHWALTGRRFGSAIGGAAGATARAAFRLAPPEVLTTTAEPPLSAARRLVALVEWVSFKGVITLFLIGLANSNPTFKQIVDAVLG
jgi:uncharacterized protein YjbI with pentapeptide repeats